MASIMLAGSAVLARTRDAFAAVTAGLAKRLLTAMEAGEAAGGDRRGKQSAALVAEASEALATDAEQPAQFSQRVRMVIGAVIEAAPAQNNE